MYSIKLPQLEGTRTIAIVMNASTFDSSSTETFLQDGYLLIWLSAAISSIFAIAAAIWLWLHTNQSIKRFLCLDCGLGSLALATNIFVLTLLGLGYID